MKTQHLRVELKDVLAKISQCDSERRHVYHHQLDRLLLLLRVDGATIPTDVVRLNKDLRQEAIEAQFDNLPV